MFIRSTDVFIQSNFRIHSKDEIQRKVRTVEARCVSLANAELLPSLPKIFKYVTK